MKTAKDYENDVKYARIAGKALGFLEVLSDCREKILNDEVLGKDAKILLEIWLDRIPDFLDEMEKMKNE